MMETPKANKSDRTHSAIKAVLNCIPYVGGGIAEIFNSIVIPSVEKRRIKWMEEVGSLLERLEANQDGIVNKLMHDEEFISLLILASINAYKTHLEEKYKMFKSVLSNSIGNDILFDVKQIFLNFVDELTVSHIKVLYFIFNNEVYMKCSNDYQKIYDIWKMTESIEKINLTTFKYLLEDLGGKGLLIISDDMQEIGNQVYQSSYITVEGDDNIENLPFIKISELGITFLSFIKD